MARVSITINNQKYDIACADGEEQHILELSSVLDSKVAELVSAIGQAGEARLLAMAGLLMADEMADIKDEVAKLEAAPVSTPTPEPGPQTSPSMDEDRLAKVLDAMAARIETIAQGLESA
ncbi:MAG: cell division protein ZapA [Magnetovibrio sp.]|nr:cell division protein ZapA [Magnetovibrio sp.]